jgi:hypothetical protein
MAEKAAEEFVVEEVKKAKIPEASAKIVVESLKSKAVVSEAGTIDPVEFGKVVKEAIDAKVAEVEAIRKESAPGITGNGQSNSVVEDKAALKSAFEEYYLDMGYDADTAKTMSELAAVGR